MVTELMIVCVTVYALFSPWIYARAGEIRERTRQLEIENDTKELQ